MAIAFDRYIRITSGVIGAGGTPQREFMARLFTTNNQVPTGAIIEFDSLNDVVTHFGAGTEEALRAAFYFSYTSPNVSRPRGISFARWANTDVGATILGARVSVTIAQLQAITAGGFTVTLAGTAAALTALDLSGAADITGAATLIQTAIRAEGGDFAQVEVTYNAPRSRFEFDSGNTGAETIAITDGAQTPLALIGWDNASAMLSDGVDAQSPVEVVTAATDRSNNYGSFLFQPTLTEDQLFDVATWNAAQNVMFQFMVPVTASTASAVSARLISIAGAAMTLTDSSLSEYPEMLPMAIFAATNYGRRNSVQNYMFKSIGGLTPSVTTTADANIYDPLRVNYYGRTQTAGQFIDFYQRGFLGGGVTDPVNMNTHANEIWLKDAAGSQIMSLLRSVGRVSANAAGRAQILSVLNGVITDALDNGTISVGRTLTEVQRISVADITGDPLAYVQVQNAGYWIDAEVETFVEDGIQQSRIVYTLVYAKDDVVREVNGTHALV